MAREKTYVSLKVGQAVAERVKKEIVEMGFGDEVLGSRFVDGSTRVEIIVDSDLNARELRDTIWDCDDFKYGEYRNIEVEVRDVPASELAEVL